MKVEDGNFTSFVQYFVSKMQRYLTIYKKRGIIKV